MTAQDAQVHHAAVLTLDHGNVPADAELRTFALSAAEALLPAEALLRRDQHPARIVWRYDRPLGDLVPLVGALTALAPPWWTIALSTVVTYARRDG